MEPKENAKLAPTKKFILTNDDNGQDDGNYSHFDEGEAKPLLTETAKENKTLVTISGATSTPITMKNKKNEDIREEIKAVRKKFT